MKCYACKTGELIKSGSHEYCSNCNFSRFVVTENYIDSCVSVLADLVSNTRFKDDGALSNFVYDLMHAHLPKLYDFTKNITGDATGFYKVMLDGIKAQAINLQIDESHYNAEEDKSLRCNCGSTQFLPGDKYPGNIFCNQCQAAFVNNQETGEYEAEFICGECGEIKWELIDDITGLCECTNCHTAHIHNHSENTFTMVTE